MYAPTQEDINRLLGYLNGEDQEVLFTEIPKTYLRMAYDLQKKLIADVGVLTRKNQELQKRLDRLYEKKEESFMSGEFVQHEAGLNDTDIALFAIHYLKKKNIHYNLEKVIHIIYLVYAVFLTRGIRIIQQQPQATGRGPWFWRASNRLEDKDEKGRVILFQDPSMDYLRTINGKDPSVAAITRNIVDKYYDIDIKAILLSSTPFLNASRENNDGKWNKTIEDKNIYIWQKKKCYE